ncbi:hypothetical protein PsorP6_000217 [Peronosclerospora sorghi]|uniref:Uncharacterized protein n=1 Tax=Peronosclerospora sorghi TaxID=230839 RepID=A0ACC0WRQ5_9STRA|nr:hypothetical protein PsorP6_000217 [Peronosclerospora sorghi]
MPKAAPCPSGVKKSKKSKTKNKGHKARTNVSVGFKAKMKNGSTNPQQSRRRPEEQQHEDDVEIDEEDIAFYEDNVGFSNFLANMDVKSFSKPANTLSDKMPLPKSANCEDREMDETNENVPLEKLEARPRQAAWTTNEQEVLRNKLPVKFMDGSVRANKLLVGKETKPKVADTEKKEEKQLRYTEDLLLEEAEMEFEEINDISASPPIVTPEFEQTAVDLKRQREIRLMKNKVEIAQLCESILENPQESFKKNKDHSEQLSKFQQLQSLCVDPDVTVQRLSLMSQLSVFLDILPEYQIRLHNSNNADVKAKENHGRPMKKKVQQMQDYEAALLNNYQKFLKFCAELVSVGLKNKRPEHLATMTVHERRRFKLAETGARCLAQLLEKKYAFNFRVSLVIALVPMADSQFATIREQVCTSFESVFKSDKTCACSYEIVRQISSYVKQKQHRVQQFIIKTLLALPLEVTMEQGEAARKKATSDRKKRRRLQADGDTIAVGLKEAEAVVDRAEREKTQADILHELILIYFRILKQATYSKALPAVLEGLAKFSFLINLDIMIDLVKVLKVVLRAEEVLPLPAALQAVLTGLRALHGPCGQELVIDEKEFVDILYRLLHRFADGEAGSDTSCFQTLLQCVEAIFLRRNEYVVERVASFVKRMLLVVQHLSPHQALACLSLLRSLFHRYSKLRQLLDSDVDRLASGEYRADIDDPDFANPFSSACWELTLLAHHAHPKLSSYALSTAQLAPPLPNEHARVILDSFDPYAGATFAFKPKIPLPPSNPLHKKIANENKNDSGKKSCQRRARQFFVRDPLANLDEQYRKQNASPFYQQCIELDEKYTDETLLVFFRK